ncbi:hypothetical protein [Marinomonas ostreistagni]|uniref:Uncharacterized protein n=1 Tax=Marinomonas ostreistagni TaxID=359209 RepID=A0ABS0Z810_9GAMM|nr:hypothetical protein [Marinomonas ostreistagni]MBJ7549785.1 hypothetical protein [Marinomonas ostreistagni]
MSNSESKYEVFSNYVIHDCLIAGPEYFVISAEKILSEEEYDYYENRGSTRLGIHNLSKQPIGEPTIWATRTWEGHSFFNTRLVNTEYKEYLMMDDAGQVFYGGLGDKKFVEDRIPPDQRCHQLTKVGDQIYGIGFDRTILKRIDHGKWEHLTPRSIRKSSLDNIGFDDMHGFSEEDLYAVGGQNDVWHYDGNDWRFIDICDDPILPMAVCCAEDGFVYIACAHGVLVRGRNEEWEVYRPEDTKVKFTEAVSYQGRIYLGSEKGVFVIEHNAETLAYKPYDFEGQISPVRARRMDVGHGLLLVASFHRVALFDGKQWKNLYGGGPSPEEEAALLEQMVRDAEESVDALHDIADKLKSAKGQG